MTVYDLHGTPTRGGRGLFAAALVAAFPHLPVEEEGRLADPRLRDNFVERVYAYRRLRSLFAARWTVADLVRFHTAHKLLLLAHAHESYRQLGRLVAGARGVSRRNLEGCYVDGFMRALAQLATTRLHTNVLQHMAGYLKDRLDAASKRELVETIAASVRSGSARGATHARSSLRANVRRCISGRTDVSATASEGIDASQSRVTGQRSAVSVPHRRNV